jgi:hypothetical protein
VVGLHSNKKPPVSPGGASIKTEPSCLVPLKCTMARGGAPQDPVPIVSIWTSDSPAAPNFGELRMGEVRRIHLPRTPVNKGRKEGRSPSVGPGPSRHADFFSGLRRHVSPRTRLRSAQLHHCCRHGDSAMLRGVNESGRLWHSALKSNELPGSLLPVHSQRGA